MQTAQLCRESERLARDHGLRAIVVESHEPYRVIDTLNRAHLAIEDVPIPVLSDAAQTVAATYGVAFQMDDTIEWADRPATFLIDKTGVLRYAHIAETSFNDRPLVADVLKAQSAMHAAARGERGRTRAPSRGGPPAPP